MEKDNMWLQKEMWKYHTELLKNPWKQEIPMLSVSSSFLFFSALCLFLPSIFIYLSIIPFLISIIFLYGYFYFVVKHYIHRDCLEIIYDALRYRRSTLKEKNISELQKEILLKNELPTWKSTKKST